MRSLKGVAEVSALISAGRLMLVAGDEALLRQLPRGRWVGGTIPYFMTDEGGVQSAQQLSITLLPETCVEAEVRSYSPDTLPQVPRDYPSQGVSFIVIPAGGEAHARFSKDGGSWSGFFDRPLVGWIAGVALEDLATSKPKVFNGATGEASEDAACVLHVKLPQGLVAKTEIINLFTPGPGDVITFDSEGFTATTCRINGEPRVLADYLEARKVDTRWPLVADFSGAHLNVSFQSVDAATRKVTFYAPVFAGIEYRLASPVENYERAFVAELERRDVEPVFTCNCILNYVYAELKGKKTGHATGPFTFGEIAWMLLNQTAVYVTFERLTP
jgi:hypothetical protein